MEEIKVVKYSENKEEKVVITIPFEEYKELLIIKGKYEELKSQYQVPWTVRPNTITDRDFQQKDKESKHPYEVTLDVD